MKRIYLTLLVLSLFYLEGYSQCTTPLQNLVEDFNNPPDPNDRTILPDCWTTHFTAPYNGRERGSIQAYQSKLLINSTYGGIAITPIVENMDGTLSFKARKEYSGNVSLEMGFFSGNTFTRVELYTLSGTEQTYSYDFANFTGSKSNRIAFRHLSSNGSAVNLTIDDVEYKSFCAPQAAPTLIAKDITTYLDASGNSIVNPASLDDGSTDDCGEPIVNFSLDKSLFTCDDLGANSVTLTATDSEGNTSTATATITVLPTIEPGFSTYLSLDANGEYSIPETSLLSSSTTQCDAVTYAVSKTSFDCTDLGSVEIAITASFNGETHTVTKTHYIIDELAPTLVTRLANVPVDPSTGFATVTPDMIDDGSYDNCGITSREVQPSRFMCGELGPQQVRYILRDSSNNTTFENVTVNITSFIHDLAISSDATPVCFDGTSTAEVTITTDTSETGVNYYLRKSADSSVVDGPIAGTGSALSFSTGSVSEQTSFDIYAEVPFDGNALSLPSGSEYLAVATPNDFDYSEGYTFSAWVKETIGGHSSHYNTLFYAGGTTGSDIEIYQNASTGAITVLHNRGNGATTSTVSFPKEALPSDEWTHLAITFDGTYATIYSGGTYFGTATIDPPVKSAGSELTFGFLNNSSFPGSQTFNGKLDDIRIYKATRMADQLENDLLTCGTPDDTTLVLHYDMENLNGTVMTDQVNATPAQIINKSANGGLVSDAALSCTYTCNRVMQTRVLVGDTEAPTIAAKDTTVAFDEYGNVAITREMVIASISDNCTDSTSLDVSFAPRFLSCDNIGDNLIAINVTDSAGNSTSATATVTVTSDVYDITLTASATNICAVGDSVTIITSGSSQGLQYSLRNHQDSSVVAGPVTGSGQSINFSTGAISETSTYHLVGETSAAEGRGLAFAKGEEYFLSQNDVTFDYSKSYTVEMWVNAPFSSSTTNSLLGIANSSTSDLEIYVQKSSRKLTISHGRINGSTVTYYQYPTPPVNQWTHIAVSYDGNSNSLKVYYDGVEQTQTLAYRPNAMVNRGPFPIAVGRITTFNGTNVNFSGSMDEVRLWSTSRTQAEIVANKDICLSGLEEGLEAYYPLNETSGMDVTDKAGNLHAELQNMDPETVWGAESTITCQGCTYQMPETITITVGDTEAPTVVTKDITVVLGESGTATITPDEVDNGSEDNCTATASLTFTLDKASFDINDLGANTVTLTVADESGNSASATAEVTVSDKELQSASFSEIPTLTYGDVNFDVSAQTNSGLAATISIVRGGLEVASSTSEATTLSIIGAGEATIRASNAGNDQYAPLQYDTTVTILKADQVLTVEPIADQSTLSDSLVIEAEVSSGLPLTYGISGPATIKDSIIILDGTVGLVEVTISQAGNDNYNSVSQSLSFNVVEKDVQTFTFTGIQDRTFGDADFNITGTSDQGLDLEYSVQEGQVTIVSTASRNGSQALIRIDGAGPATILASNQGDDTYAPFAQSLSFNVNKADQVLTIDPIPNHSQESGAITVVASVDTELPLSYSVSGPASISDNVITLDGSLGTVTVTVTQVGNDNYNEVSGTVSFEVIEKLAQTISFAALDPITYGDGGVTLSATASSSLPVSFSIISGPGTITAGKATTLVHSAAGTIRIAAIQKGDNSYLAADTVFQDLVVNRAILTATANDVTYTYGSKPPPFQISYSGFVNGENKDVLRAEPTLTAPASPDAGTYTITLAGGEADNYSLQLQSGTLIVEQAEAQITITDLEFTHDGTAKSPTVTTNPEGLNYTVTYNDEAEAPDAVGTYAVAVTIDEVNYFGSQTATLTIATLLGVDHDIFQIYPNPSSGSFQVTSSSQETVQVYDLTGQLLRVAKTNERIDITDLPAGAYLIRVGKKEMQKLIKK
ncbi:LamG-like jellyroll fold domain-containing protein [Marinoscillum furvescens]|uniref:Putative secreted protein (Por secretion system target) n=1 Tax=Marinoscillum furvescens DSM 4134 TaxID=1122208 RepID=A0A3D9L2Q7_MARFU|nr:LamG-like jellyroll fold domain-containing protein [Marinoscillum furvescens]RED98905.1 putative secreted protein (Por secretion system target) [Marinoscillum furvescens DSM 4134]